MTIINPKDRPLKKEIEGMVDVDEAATALMSKKTRSNRTCTISAPLSLTDKKLANRFDVSDKLKLQGTDIISSYRSLLGRYYQGVCIHSAKSLDRFSLTITSLYLSFVKCTLFLSLHVTLVWVLVPQRYKLVISIRN